MQPTFLSFEPPFQAIPQRKARSVLPGPLGGMGQASEETSGSN